jgi:4a-hydroxytetrahydrobiopterin dehydratase
MENWKINKEGFLTKEFEFEDFVSAVKFVVKAAEIAEAKKHPPDIKLHSYNKVNIFLKTHSENKLTEKDYNLAKGIDEMVKTVE